MKDDMELLYSVLKQIERFDPSAEKHAHYASYEARGVLITIAAKLAIDAQYCLAEAWWMQDPDDKDYFIQFISLPKDGALLAGPQFTWHMTNDCERVGPNHGWDGHTTEQKYKRIRSL